ncbi:phosphate ABC transporter ATP-binding protein [Hydrogenophaga sp.]|uniref:ABC transporter ATP-binding protein n=1 Tax=Hydrogenophaga sp. TaxID=1904254 RepID=UPI0025C4B56D|nr:phosphate ABC transporter ATP-binding protein [Hydrogenophaga sp.]
MTGMPPAPNIHSPVCLALQQAQVRLGASGRVVALQNIDLSIGEGERVALVGANGCGKSTLLRALHGLQPLFSGSLQRMAQQRVAMLFQRPHLLRLSAQRNIALGLRLQGTPWREACGLALVALERVGMADLAQRNGRALSGGQQQRLALARAWALKPSVWLLDEPTASLDPHAKREVEALIQDFCGDSGDGPPATLVFASHNLGQVKRLASRVIYLEQGRLLADLPVHQFFNHEHLEDTCPSAHLFVQGESL